jgi:hypothetical protein
VLASSATLGTDLGARDVRPADRHPDIMVDANGRVRAAPPLVRREVLPTTRGMAMYVRPNVKTKKALREAVAAGGVKAFQPGPYGPGVPDGRHAAEGPHYPEPHKWWATVEVRGGEVVRVL